MKRLLPPLFLALVLLDPPAGREGDAPPPPDEEVDLAFLEFGGNNGFSSDDQFAKDRAEFEEAATPEDGLGPVFNSDSCASCHHNPVTGGSSTVTELRAGVTRGGKFEAHPGGSLIHSRALSPEIQERVQAGFPLRGLRISPSVLGLGFVECIGNDDLTDYAARQPEAVRGEAVLVPILEAKGDRLDKTRVGRFGWKCQHASLVSFAADAQLNEKGITSPLLLKENSSNGRDVGAFDRAADPEDHDEAGNFGDQGFGFDVEAYARFMRSTAAPPPDARVAALDDAVAGLDLFRSLGCAACHREQYTTLPPGTRLNANTLTVPPALGGKVIHPYSDFLLHDVGSGDGIVQAGPQSTANKFRTAPLWGLRTRPRLFHDGLTFTRHEAILRHGGQAAPARDVYRRMSSTRQRQLHVFLRSL